VHRIGRAAAAVCICAAGLLFAAGCGSSAEDSVFNRELEIVTETTETTETSQTTVTTSSVTKTQATTGTSATETAEETTVTATTAAAVSAPPVTVAATTAAATTTAAPAVTLAAVTETYGTYPLNAAATELLGETVFVGDSICYGLKAYHVLPDNNVVALGGIGVRNIFNYTYEVGNQSYDVISALTMLQPKNVVFSIGMNDIRMETRAEYCANYRILLERVRESLPEARLYVVSITPVLSTSTFTDNATIDSYNAALCSFAEAYQDAKYLDVTKELKNEWNALKYNYQSGDGLHLSKAAYQPYLYQICEQMLAMRAEETTATETSLTTVSATVTSTASSESETTVSETTTTMT